MQDRGPQPRQWQTQRKQKRWLTYFESSIYICWLDSSDAHQFSCCMNHSRHLKMQNSFTDAHIYAEACKLLKIQCIFTVTEQSESMFICSEVHNKWNKSYEIKCEWRNNMRKGLKDWAERLWGSWLNWKQIRNYPCRKLIYPLINFIQLSQGLLFVFMQLL